jgi:Subtilase family
MLSQYLKVIQIVVPLLAIIFYILPLGLTTAQNGGGSPPSNDPYAQLTQGPPPPSSSSGTGAVPDNAQGCNSKDIAIAQAGSSSNCGQLSAGTTEDTESAATLASPATLTSPTTLIPSSIIPTKVPSDQWSLIQYCQSTDCPNIKIIQRTILDRPYAVLPSPEFIRALRQDLIPTTDINALAATIPAQYPGVEVFNVIDTPGYKAIAIRGVDINNPIFSDPRFSSTEQHIYSGHIAQVGQNQGQPLIWNQTLPNGVKRTIPISLNPTTVVIPATVVTPPTIVTPATSNAQPIGGASQISSTSTSSNTSGYSSRGNSIANQGPTTTSEQIESESGLNDFNNVDIAVLDTGISLIHPDLNVYRNVSFVDGTSSGDDDQGHGSHVAGIAAAKDNSIGVRGVAPDARLWAIKVCDKFGECKVSNQMKGIEYATKHANEIDVLNISIENPNSPALNSVINEAVKAGITVVVAAGNSGSDASTVSPANNPNVLTVSAIGDSDGRCGGLGPAMEESDGKVTDDTFAYFSNFGPEVKLAAPGVDIFSTYNGTDYALDSGTSMATPHAAGAAAVYKAQFPNASPAQIMAELEALGSTPSTQCDGGPRGYFTGDTDGINEPLLFAALLPS